jgi:hypothetical protein
MYPKVMKYMEWSERIDIDTCLSINIAPKFDANDMLLTMNKLVEDGKWSMFHNYAVMSNLDKSIVKIIAWLFQPTNFFRLLEEWLPEVKR